MLPAVLSKSATSLNNQPAPQEANGVEFAPARGMACFFLLIVPSSADERSFNLSLRDGLRDVWGVDCRGTRRITRRLNDSDLPTSKADRQESFEKTPDRDAQRTDQFEFTSERPTWPGLLEVQSRSGR